LEELGRLSGHLAATMSGDDRVVVVSGDAGIGKSRLVGELMASAAAQGVRVFYGGGDEDGALSYQPFVEALEDYVSETLAPLSDESIEEALGELARLMPTARLRATPRDPLGDPEVQRFRLFQAVALVLEHAAGDRPLLLVLDDLQWADRPTRQLLRHLLRAGTSGRRLIVAVHRKPGLATFLRGLRRETEVDHLELSGLGADDLAELVGDRLPGAPMPVVMRLHDETAGNPLFVGEVLRSLGGHTVAESVAALDELEVPDEVVDVVTQRLERLEERTVDALKAAAVAGREFDLAVLERVLSLPADDVLDALDDARTEDLIIEHREVLDRF
jgi:predicted ATPase